MCNYSGKKDDPQRHSPDDLPHHVVNDMTNCLLNESLIDCGKVGLRPFCKTNPAPVVSRQAEQIISNIDVFVCTQTLADFHRPMTNSGKSNMIMRPQKEPGRPRELPGEPS